MQVTVWNAVKRQMQRARGGELTDGVRRLTYQDVISCVEFRAAAMPQGVYAIRCQNELNTALSLLACFCAGVTAIPLCDRYGTVHCDRILRTAEPDFLITDTDGKLRTAALKPEPQPIPDPPALILYTSGSTGVPKGAMISHANLMSNLAAIGEYFDLTPADRVLIARPLYHGAVLTGEFLMSLTRGARISFCSAPFEPFTWAERIAAEGISVLGGTPTVFFHLSRLFRRSDKLRSLCKLVISGEPMTAPIAAAVRAAFPKADVYHVYGLTEASPRVSALPPSLFDSHPESCGYPLRGVTVAILSPDGTEVADGEEGELCVRGGNVMTGYYKAPELTAHTLRNGWLHTGDAATRDRGGLLHIKGRLDDMIIRAGINIYPREIESAISTFPGLTAALVQAAPDPLQGQRIILLITGENVNLAAFTAFCRSQIPPHRYPDEIRQVPALPLTPSGKRVRTLAESSFE